MMTLAAMIGVATIVLTPLSTVGASPSSDIQSGADAAGGGAGGPGGTNQPPTLGAQIKTVVNIMLYLLGAIAVVMIVIGGIRYTTSNGDSGSIKSAKDTILYSVIGLIVAILAYSIVNFVLSQFK